MISGSHQDWGLDTTELGIGTYYPLYLWRLDQDTLTMIDTLSDKKVYQKWRSFSNCNNFKWIPQAKVFTFKESGHYNLEGFDYAKSLHYGDSLELYVWDSIPNWFPISTTESYVSHDTFLFKETGVEENILFDHKFNRYKIEGFDTLYFFENGYPNTEIGTTTGRRFSIDQKELYRHNESILQTNIMNLCLGRTINNFKFPYQEPLPGFTGIINTSEYFVFNTNQYKLEEFKKGKGRTSTTLYYIIDKKK